MLSSRKRAPSPTVLDGVISPPRPRGPQAEPRAERSLSPDSTPDCVQPAAPAAPPAASPATATNAPRGAQRAAARNAILSATPDTAARIIEGRVAARAAAAQAQPPLPAEAATPRTAPGSSPAAAGPAAPADAPADAPVATAVTPPAVVSGTAETLAPAAGPAAKSPTEADRSPDATGTSTPPATTSKHSHRISDSFYKQMFLKDNTLRIIDWVTVFIHGADIASDLTSLKHQADELEMDSEFNKDLMAEVSIGTVAGFIQSLGDATHASGATYISTVRLGMQLKEGAQAKKAKEELDAKQAQVDALTAELNTVKREKEALAQKNERQFKYIKKQDAKQRGRARARGRGGRGGGSPHGQAEPPTKQHQSEGQAGS